MPIVQTINTKYKFLLAFREHEGLGRREQFTPVALGALFDYCEQLSDDTGEPFVLDVVGICCEWCEYANAEEIEEAYGCTPEEMKDRTTVIHLDGGGFLIISC